MDASPAVAGRRADRRAGRRRRPAIACLVAAAGLVLGGATAQNGTQAPQGHQRAEHDRVRLLAATLGSDSWTGDRGAWSGYVVKGGDNYEVMATFTVSTLYCQSWQEGAGTALWVGIQSTDSNGTATIVQDGIGYRCGNGGQPQYYAWMVQNAYSQLPVPISNPVYPGDTITAIVYEMGSTYLMALDDTTENWFTFNSVTGGADSSNWAAVAAESYYGGAYLDPVAVTGAQVNGLPLGQFNPEADEQGPNIYNGTAGLDPSGLDSSGQDFNFHWNGQPGLAMMSGELLPERSAQPAQG
jgi:hypothetical protein